MGEKREKRKIALHTAARHAPLGHAAVTPMGSPEPRRRHCTRRCRRCTLMASHAAAVSHSRLGPLADLGGGGGERRRCPSRLLCSAGRGEAEICSSDSYWW